MAAACIVSAFASCAAVCCASLWFVRQSSSLVYVVDAGKVVAARQSDDAMDLEMEVKDQVLGLHGLLFDLTPNATAIRERQDRALEIADRSVFSYIRDLQETGYYNRIIQGNISQQLLVDSVRIDMTVYPYEVRTYARQYAMRESTVSLYDFESSCRVVRSGRSAANPHGLIVEGFAVVRSELKETRKRNGYGKAE